MSSPRFFVTRLPQSGRVQLDAAEARHAASVLRLTIGDPVVLFDGLGGEATGVVEQLDKRLIEIEIGTRTNTDRELPAKLELIVALPKGDRQKTLLEGLVQLGVTQLTPLASDRAVAQPTTAAMERLERAIVEASKQSGRNRLMRLGDAVTVRQLAEQPAEVSERLFAHPHLRCQVIHRHRPESMTQKMRPRRCDDTGSGGISRDLRAWHDERASLRKLMEF